jgi:protein-L-isoaspartate O-methyltransferase
MTEWTVIQKELESISDSSKRWVFIFQLSHRINDIFKFDEILTKIKSSISGCDNFLYQKYPIIEDVNPLKKSFLPQELQKLYRIDIPFPLEKKSTLSAESIISRQLFLSNLQKNMSLLEIGSGSGYLAAIGSRRVSRYFGIEISPSLVKWSELKLEENGIRNANIIHSNQRDRLTTAQSAFDRIIISAQTKFLPIKWLSHLREGGRCVVPIKPREVSITENIISITIPSNNHTNIFYQDEKLPVRGNYRTNDTYIKLHLNKSSKLIPDASYFIIVDRLSANNFAIEIDLDTPNNFVNLQNFD